MKKPYTAKSLTGATQRVRDLERIVATLKAKIGALKNEQSDLLIQRDLLARLAADGPAFNNPALAMHATNIRDKILAANGLCPDGSPLPQLREAHND